MIGNNLTVAGEGKAMELRIGPASAMEMAETIFGAGITIDNINTVSNPNLYIDTPAATNSFHTEMDGFTVTLTLKAPVIPNKTNSFRLAVADAGDGVYESAVLIAAQSVQVALPTGDVVTVLAGGGVLSIQSAGNRDDYGLTYEVSDGTGTADVAFVTVNILACFTADTQIAVPGGRVAVAHLRVGDLVSTRDHGPQALRWLGCRSVPARGADAPVEISAGTFGAHGKLRLSPNHRVLIEGVRAELLFGEAEVLRLFPALAADHLACDRLARPELQAHEVPLLQVG